MLNLTVLAWSAPETTLTLLYFFLVTGKILFWACYFFWGGGGRWCLVVPPTPKKKKKKKKNKARPGVSAAHIAEHTAQTGRQAGAWQQACGVKISAKRSPSLGPRSNVFAEERQYSWATKPPLIARLISLSGLPSKCNITAFGASSVRYYFWRPLHVN